MKHLPSRLGKNRALDDAVRLICNPRPGDALQAYGVALRSLQNNIDRGISPEALGAATLLHMHELSQDSSSSSWALHAKGVINMLKVRGAEGIESEFDKSLLRAQVGNIYFAALRDGQPCFLALPEWNAKIRPPLHQHRKGMGVTRDWEMLLISIGVHVPGLICRFENVARNCIASSLVASSELIPLLDDLKSVREELEDALQCVVPSGPKLDIPQSGQGQHPSSRLRPALLFSANIYLTLIDYMHETAARECFCMPDETPRCIAPYPVKASDDVRLTGTMVVYERLWNLDAVAARSTAGMMKLTIERVLFAADPMRTNTGTTSLVLNRVLKMLACQPQEISAQRQIDTSS